MKNSIAELVLILDCSGSVADMETDTIGGFNAIIEKQRKLHGTAYTSTVLFDNEPEVLHDRVSIEKIEPMTDSQYTVGGCTAMLDAIGGAIHQIGNIHKYARTEDVPEHTLFVITTDGMENASHRYNGRTVKQMIKYKQEKYGWEFILVAANIDAVETAAQIGVCPERAANYYQTASGTRSVYDAANCAMTHVRFSLPIDNS